MIIPIIFIAIGAYFLYHNSGGTFDFSMSWSFYWPVVLILMGLFMILRKRPS